MRVYITTNLWNLYSPKIFPSIKLLFFGSRKSYSVETFALYVFAKIHPFFTSFGAKFSNSGAQHSVLFQATRANLTNIFFIFLVLGTIPFPKFFILFTSFFASLILPRLNIAVRRIRLIYRENWNTSFKNSGGKFIKCIRCFSL